ncbi:MAG: hypothetical protein UY05_C0018G0019 [Candidatus Peregrinibacteria bacterium GW2011_GWA2_47_7]|nr:MAG: hypothetical protein UY05_C0018G0019 [Candidatus Peregrinibacteria bacterium GW2011_GWA2_47_7]
MQQKQKNHSRHAYIRALLFFAVIFSVAFLSKSFAAQETLPRQDSIKTCIARIFELDREKIFADVGSQQWYTHAVHFLVLLDEGLAASPAGENDATPQLPKFSPKKVVLQNEFAKWLSSYSILFDDARTSSLAKFSSRVKKKLTRSSAHLFCFLRRNDYCRNRLKRPSVSSAPPKIPNFLKKPLAQTKQRPR